MKKISHFILFALMSVCGGLFAGEEKVFELETNPRSYFKFLEQMFADYWRLPDDTANDKMKSDLKVMFDSFEADSKKLQSALRVSGLFNIENIDFDSYRVEDDSKKYFRNEIKIEFDADKESFLQGLIKKLPEHKIPKIENPEQFNDLHVITDDTLLAFDLPLNFVEAVKAIPADSDICKDIGGWTKEYLGMSFSEFADQLTGEWGGVVYVNRPDEKKPEFYLDFVFIIPDPEQRFYKRLGEKLVVQRRAVYKDKLLNVRMLAKYPGLTLMSVNDFLLICSSPQSLVKFGEIAKKKEICSRIKKINVPEDLEYDAFYYCNESFSAVADSFFMAKNLPLKFMQDFSGNDTFSAADIDDGEIEIVEYSNASGLQRFLMPFTVNAMLHIDNFIFKRGRKKYIEQKLTDFNNKCLDDMNKLAGFLLKYSEANGGKFPGGINAEGLRKLADFAKIPHSEFSVKLKDKKIMPFGRFYYWGENCSVRDPKMPLLTDRGGIHKEKLHVIFCDGSVREFKLGNIRSARRIVSFLHTVFRYDNDAFSKLMKQAERLDSEKL